ncbi:MAG: hypothetical protein ACK5SQ_01895 [Chitinophagales bacterium]
MIPVDPQRLRLSCHPSTTTTDPIDHQPPTPTMGPVITPASSEAQALRRDICHPSTITTDPIDHQHQPPNNGSIANPGV